MSPVPRPQLFFHTAALAPGAFRVIRLGGFEAIGQLYELELGLELTEDTPLDVDAVDTVLASPALVGFAENGMVERPWHGIVRELELLEADETHAPVYRAVLVPTAWYLTQTLRTRVFLQKSTSDIVKEVLTEHGLAQGDHFELSLQATYPPREHVLQYQESDLDFIARLLEHEGAFYFFDQREDGEVMVITDNNSAFATAEGHEEVRFDPRDGITVPGGAVHRITRRYRLVPQHVVLRDYQPDQPRSPIQTDHLVDSKGFGLVMLHGQNAPSEAEQRRLAKARAEERAVDKHVHHAIASVRGMHPGTKLTLVGHPFGELQDAELVVVGARHYAEPGSLSGGDGGEPYHAELDLVPVSVPYRAPRLTPKPRIDGVVHAKVDGEVAGTPAPIDEQGRYRVLLPYDVATALGGRASCWIRMAQPYAGPAYGMHFPLHIGADVLIAHVEGDPDRPVIVGALPTPDLLSPVIKDNATQSMVRTKGNVEMVVEDDAK
ncbi:MAG: type VI secretion system tip protein VgrG [Sandaracinaceae bacterium]|nr:type VI secretion system tip protein VgrG [Sandaracinaceae bacterium]